MAKIATIKNFSNMEDSGVFYLESMAARKVGGQSILTPAYRNSYTLSESTSGFTNLGVIRNGVPVDIEQNTTFLYDGSGYIHEFKPTGTDIGQIHRNTSVIDYCDIVVTKNEHILYSGLDYLGYGHNSTATGGSTTTLVDTATAFDTLIVGAGAGINKVYSITNTELYTVTSLTGSNTLNFSAGTAIANNNQYMVFLDTGKTNGGSNWDFFDTTSYPQFTGQELKTDFKRQIELLDEEYLIGNGNFLASLNVDETTWDDNHKQLPDQTQFQCMGNNQGNLLVGATRRGKGVLLLWDGYTDGWQAIEELEQIPTCIKPYSAGWLVVVGTALYYSNGYQTKLISRFPDTDELGDRTNTFYNSMQIINNRVIINNDIGAKNRGKSGTWIYEFGSGWVIAPFNNNTGSPFYNVSSGAVFSTVDYPTNPHVRNIYTSFQDSSSTNASCLNWFNFDNAQKYSVIFNIDLPRKVNISQIKLNISPQYYGSVDYGTVVVNLSVGDGKNQFWRGTQAATGSTTTLIKNTLATSGYQAGIVGHQVRILEGDYSGERSYVQSIANAGTATEALTISPALSGSPANGTDVNLIALKLADQQSFSGKAIPDEMPFTVEGFYGDKLLFEVDISSPTATLIDIHSIDIYGE